MKVRLWARLKAPTIIRNATGDLFHLSQKPASRTLSSPDLFPSPRAPRSSQGRDFAFADAHRINSYSHGRMETIIIVSRSLLYGKQVTFYLSGIRSSSRFGNHFHSHCNIHCMCSSGIRTELSKEKNNKTFNVAKRCTCGNWFETISRQIPFFKVQQEIYVVTIFTLLKQKLYL